MSRVKEKLSEQAVQLAQSGKSALLYTTLQVAKRLSIRSMTLMRWIVNEDIRCPAAHVSGSRGLHWLWNEAEIQAAAEFKKWVFQKKTHWRSHPNRRTGRSS